MSQMIGADPDALDRLAADFDRGAGTLEATALRVRVSVHANPWAGARATRFRSDWDQRHGPQLKRTATILRTAAKQLRQQAAEQRRASSAGGVSGAGRAAGTSVQGRSSGAWPARLDAAVSVLMEALGVGRDFAEVMVDALDQRLMKTGLSAATRDLILDSRLATALRISGTGLAVVGVAQGVFDVVAGNMSNDEARVWRGGLGVGGVAVGLVNAPLGIAVAAASAYGDFMLATDAEEISAVEARTMRSRFGDGVTEPYTPQQAEWLSERYDGAGGFLNAIGDQVDHGMRWMNDPISDAAKDFRSWRHAQGWW